ncbi:hypothetical protein C8R43DRAFT_1118145 [Mycena crocata]|nr:hypothetical protein C8R43DRAFT_1118145 [Mycena crocata]
MLAALAPLSEFTVASPVALPNGRFRKIYVHAETLEPLAPAVVGTIREIISVGDGVKILVLRKPTPDTGFVATLFLHQLTVLQRLANTDSHELRRVDGLSHEPTAPNPLLSFASSTDLDDLGLDVATVEEGRPLLEPGAVVLCHVDVHRTSWYLHFAHPGLPTRTFPPLLLANGVSIQALALDASYITRFSSMPSSP